MNEEEIIREYTQLVRSRARRFYLIGAEQEDVIQEGMIGLLYAIRSYREDKNTSFATFADKCIQGQIMKAVQATGRIKRLSLNMADSIEDINEYSATDINDVENPETILINREENDSLLQSLNHVLSSKEEKVLEKYLEGFSYEEIGEKLNITTKAVDNAIQRIRRKVKEILK